MSYLRVRLGLVLFRDGVQKVQDGDGRFMEPGQQTAPGEHRGAVRVFGVSSLEAGRTGMVGRIVSTDCQ